MSEETLVCYCSATLAGLKTASMFSVECRDRKRLEEQLRSLNRMLGPKGLRVIPLRFAEGRALIYLFRPKRLARDLSEETAVEILADCGYPAADPASCLSALWKRLRSGEGFPHEIGLFLGYPPEDVKGFISAGPACAKCTGYWKVYSDEEKAKRVFDKYRRCARAYRSQISVGRSLERLAVADN